MELGLHKQWEDNMQCRLQNLVRNHLPKQIVKMEYKKKYTWASVITGVAKKKAMVATAIRSDRWDDGVTIRSYTSSYTNKKKKQNKIYI
jgi:hypothetical protein